MCELVWYHSTSCYHSWVVISRSCTPDASFFNNDPRIHQYVAKNGQTSPLRRQYQCPECDVSYEPQYYQMIPDLDPGVTFDNCDANASTGVVEIEDDTSTNTNAAVDADADADADASASTSANTNSDVNTITDVNDSAGVDQNAQDGYWVTRLMETVYGGYSLM